MYGWLRVHDFRSYDDYRVALARGVTIIVGPNGSGKTNLLEALYVLSRGVSFRVGDKDLVRYGTQGFLLEALYGDQRRAVAFNPAGQPAKQFSLDGAKKQRLVPEQRVPVVLFEPDDLRLISGSPQRRREYLDGLIIRLWPAMAKIKNQFERTLLQRNAVLKNARQPAHLGDQLFVWDIKLAELAKALVQRRQQIVAYYNQALGDSYSSISQKKSTVAVRYQSDVNGDYQTTLLHLLHAKARDDWRRGFTSVGPHRDDLQFILNGVDASVSASRGELRTLALSVKMAELHLVRTHGTRAPLLLLDDVLSELDRTRQTALAAFAREYQTIITTTEADALLRTFPDGAYTLLRR